MVIGNSTLRIITHSIKNNLWWSVEEKIHKQVSSELINNVEEKLWWVIGTSVVNLGEMELI